MLTRIYLQTAKHLLKWGHKEQAIEYLAMALGECNRAGLVTAERMHVLRALSYARRI